MEKKLRKSELVIVVPQQTDSRFYDVVGQKKKIMLVVKLRCIFSKMIKWQSEHDDKIKIANRDSVLVRQVLRTYMYM